MKLTNEIDYSGDREKIAEELERAKEKVAALKEPEASEEAPKEKERKKNDGIRDVTMYSPDAIKKANMLLTREEYKKIKHFDKIEMAKYLNEKLSEAYQAGIKAGIAKAKKESAEKTRKPVKGSKDLEKKE